MRLFRHVLLWLLLALAGALTAQILVQDPGYVLVRYRGIDIETSLGALVLLLALSGFGLWLLWSLLRLPLGAWRRRRERRRGQRLSSGLEALALGDYARAVPLLARVAQHADATTAALAHRAAAEAATARGDDAGAQRHREALRALHPALHALENAETALREGRDADALAALDALPAPLPPKAQALRAAALAAQGARTALPAPPTPAEAPAASSAAS